MTPNDEANRKLSGHDFAEAMGGTELVKCRERTEGNPTPDASKTNRPSCACEAWAMAYSLGFLCCHADAYLAYPL